jgi:hypothetical protein
MSCTLAAPSLSLCTPWFRSWSDDIHVSAQLLHQS